MRQTWLKKARVDELMSAYTEAAVAHGRATENGDYKTGNKNADIIIKIYAELRVRGREAQMALLPLLAHEDPGARSWAAAHTFEFAPEQGEPVLEQLATIPHSIVAFTARETLLEWRKGTLRFP